MTNATSNHQYDPHITRRSIFIGAAAALILCARHRAGHKSDAGAPFATTIWTSVRRVC